MRKYLLITLCAFPYFANAGTDYAASCSPPDAAKLAKSPLNKMTMDVARSIEERQGYEGKEDRPIIVKLQSSVTVNKGQLKVNNQMKESFCSAGTYLAFLKVIEKAQASHMISLSQDSLQAILPKNKDLQPDGVGIWGRWNSDGQGTAILYKELEIGHSTHDINEGEQGDFAKIDWKNGGGHSVVFDSVRQCKTCASCAADELNHIK